MASLSRRQHDLHYQLTRRLHLWTSSVLHRHWPEYACGLLGHLRRVPTVAALVILNWTARSQPLTLYSTYVSNLFYTFYTSHVLVFDYYAPDCREGAISIALSVRPSVCPSVCQSVVYIVNNLRTQRPSMPKFGRKVAHLRCESHTSFKVKQSKVKETRGHTCWPNLAATLLVDLILLWL